MDINFNNTDSLLGSQQSPLRDTKTSHGTLDNQNNSTIENITGSHGTYVPPGGATSIPIIPTTNPSIKEGPSQRNSVLQRLKSYLHPSANKSDDQIANNKIDREARDLHEAISAIKENNPSVLKKAQQSVKEILNEDQTYTTIYADHPNQQQIWNNAVDGVFSKARATIREEEDNAVIAGAGNRVAKIMDTKYPQREETALKILKEAILETRSKASSHQPPLSDDELLRRAQSILAQIEKRTSLRGQ